jgi:hypothetical protein
VVVEANDTGTGNLLGLELAPDRVVASMRRINQIALNLKRNGDIRTMDQLRADVLLDLVAGTPTTAGSTGPGMVDLSSDLVSLAGLSETPGELGGYGPVIADIARQVADRQHDGEWRWTLRDPDTGQPIDGGITKRRPTTTQRRIVEIRDRSCVHPGCRMPSTDCDLDHTISWAESNTTDIDNLAPLCRYHHRIKHQHGWTYDPLPAAEFGEDKLEPRLWRGNYQFTSSLGHIYTTTGQPP